MAATILDKIVATKRQEIAAAKSFCSFENLQARLPHAPALRSFLEPLKQPGNIRLIAEVKKASPSKGLIRADFNPLAIAMAYQEAGASCLSVLTDEQYFQGSLTYLSEVRQAVAIPILRKEFILDRYQVLEARVAGADAVLLIAECLTASELEDLYQYARSLGLHVLIELYDEENLNHVLDTGCELIGVNNRDLRTFEVDLQHVVRLRKKIPTDRIVVAESGIASSSEAAMLYQHGIAAMLVGESLMRQADIVAATKALLATGFN